MTHRERAIAALNHRPTDRPPMDLGSTSVSGIAAQALVHLREALGLEGLTHIQDPLLFLGRVEEDVRKVLDVDFVGISSPGTKYGFQPEGEAPFTLADGSTALIAGNFRYTTDEQGRRWAYPQNDTTCPPSAMMPRGGHYFDPIARQQPYDEDDLDGRRDFREQFKLMSEETLRFLEERSIDLYKNTDYALVGNFGGMGLGDAAHVPAPALKDTPGIRDMADWMMAHSLFPEYIEDIFAMQTEIALKNLEAYHQAMGDRIQVINMSGTDFGTQRGLLFSPAVFRRLYKPFYKKANDWVHAHTDWKTFYHSCGAVSELMGDFVEMGADILNPVQCSAAGMDPQTLKDTWGDKLVFWGGGADTQHTLPCGTPEEAAAQARERCDIFSPGGGYVFSAIHDIQADTPAENILAIFREVSKCQ